MQVGTVAIGRIGLRVLRPLKPFDVKLHYMDRHRLPESVEKELNLTQHTNLESLTKVCDVVTLNCPLHRETEHMINARTLANFKRRAYLINTARQAVRSRGGGRSAKERPVRGLRGRCVVPPAGTGRPPVAVYPTEPGTPAI